MLSPTIFTAGIVIIGVALLGLVLGSFASALAYRIPRGITWAGSSARSQCRFCQSELTWPDLFPIASWLVLRGRCRHCGQYIGSRYIVLELASFLLCMAIYASYGISLSAFLAMASVPFLLALSAKDDITDHVMPLSLLVYPALFGTLFQHDLLVSSGADNVFTPVIDPGSIAGYAIAMVSYMAICLFCVWLFNETQTRDGTALSLATFGAMSGLWLTLHVLHVFFLVVLAARAASVVRKGTVFGPQSANIRVMWPVVVIAFYCTLLVQGNLAGIMSLLYFN